MAYTILESVHVDMRADGIDLSAAYEPGDHDLPRPVAELLMAQGLAVEAVSKKAAKSNTTTTAEPDTEA